MSILTLIPGWVMAILKKWREKGGIDYELKNQKMEEDRCR
jgi:hypothetical protein